MALIGLQWLLFRSGIAATNQCHVGAFIRSKMEASHPNIQLHFFPVCFKGWVPLRDTHGFRIAAGPMRPTSRGELRLRSSDPREPPAIDPRYLSTRHDQAELRESYAVIQNLISQKAFSRFRGPPLEPKFLPGDELEVDAMIAALSTSGFHLCGTCKMGDYRDPSAVVDPQTRVRGVDGLRVVDASIMPSIVSSNINAPVMMVAERASDLIRATQGMGSENVPI
jgi:choline dehydrogenase